MKMNTGTHTGDGGEQVRGMSRDKHGYHYADMEMDGHDDQGMVIPPKTAASADGQGLTPNEKVRRFIESFNIATGEKAFVQQAQQLAEQVEREAEFVPFKRYYPQYDSMTESQRKWYFYWRNEVRYERYLRSDLSYIFLYVYELINGVGWKEPQDGYYMLMEVWTAYRSDFPKLDDYMGDWIADFVLVHQLDIPFAELAERVPHGIFGSKDLYELELLHRFQQETIEFTLEMLAALSDYNVMRSKFYMGGGRKDLETYVPKVLAVVDRYMLTKHGQRLIDYLHPREVEKRERVLFRGALYDSSLHGKRVKIGVVPLSTHPPLRAMVTQLIRLTENTLRKLRGFKGKLRMEAVDEEIRLLIERYLEREFGVVTQPPRPKVRIDTEKLAQLQAESNQVREWLTVEETDGASAAAVMKREADGASTVTVMKQEADGASTVVVNQEADGASAAAVIKQESVETVNAIEVEAVPGQAHEQGHEQDQGKEDERSHSNGHGIANDRGYDESEHGQRNECQDEASEHWLTNKRGHANEKNESRLMNETNENRLVNEHGLADEVDQEANARRYLQDANEAVLDREHADVYVNSDANAVERSSVRPLEMEQVEREHTPSTAGLDEEWTALADSLQPVHLEVLKLLLRDADTGALFQLAGEYGSMPELLIEEINTAAMDSIGDLVIDGDAIVDEYRTIVEQWLGDDR